MNFTKELHVTEQKGISEKYYHPSLLSLQIY